jgi:PAP2 superfamily
MRTLWLVLCSWLALSCASTASDQADRSAQTISRWNEQVLRIAEEEDAFLTLKGVRAAAMMHLAMHDALNSIEPRFRRYAYRGSGGAAEPIAALAEAAYAVAVAQYPQQRALLASLRDEAFRGVSSASAREASRRLGQLAARAVLGVRGEDGWDAESEYTWHPMGPGVYAEFHEHSGTPQGFVFGAGWATATPFVLRAADQFRSAPPPPIESDAYSQSFEEVKSLGGYSSERRSVDQTHIAMWWKDFVENSHNLLARRLEEKDELDLWTAARLYALLNMAIVDGYISSFESKFHYNFWRPYTAIRWAESDGNPATLADPKWDTLHRHTYPFPSYPSAHGTVCAAAMSIFEDVFGERYAFTMETALVDKAGPLSGKVEMRPSTRSFGSFDAAAEECARSRVYLGIHFAFDSSAGAQLGRQVGEYVLKNALQPRE